MKREINIDTWERADQFRFFSQFTEPFFGVTVRVDCTKAYRYAKEHQLSFFLVYLYQALKAANQTEAFRYRISNGNVFLFDQVHASPTINRPNGTFGFAYMDFYTDEAQFYAAAQREIDSVQQSTGLVPAVTGENVIHFSAVPWLDFSSLSHARNYNFPDSCPKISFGKVTEENGIKTMPVSVHVHHALADGFHVGQFVDAFQAGMNGL